MADRIQRLTVELRGEILGDVAVREGLIEDRMKLLDTRVTGDLRMNCRDLGMRIDQVEQAVKKNSKLITEMEARLVRPECSDSPCRQSPLVRTNETPLGRRTFPTKDGSVRSALVSRTASVSTMVPKENE